MFGVSFFELAVIFGVALLVFGPEKLPEFARVIGKMMAEFRRNTDAVRREFYNSIYTPAEDLKKRVENSARQLTSIPLNEPTPPKTDPAPPVDPLKSEKS